MIRSLSHQSSVLIFFFVFVFVDHKHLNQAAASRLSSASAMKDRTKAKLEQLLPPVAPPAARRSLRGTHLMMTTLPTSLQRNSKLRTKSLLVTFVDVHDVHTLHHLSVLRPLCFSPDPPSELEPTSCEELIPGLQASAAETTPQETGASSLSL